MLPLRQAFGEQVRRIVIRIDIAVLHNFACMEIAAVVVADVDIPF